jgi:hypothetical protein
MNLFVLFGDGAITSPPPPQMTETLHHALHAMMQFPAIFFRVIFHHQTKKINKFIPLFIWGK